MGKVPDDGRAASLKRFVSYWTDIVSAGSVLLTGNLTLRKNEDDFRTFFKEQGLETLMTLTQQRQKILHADQSLEKMEEELTTNGLADLVTMHLPESIQSELSAKSFDDAVSFQAAAHVRCLEDLVQQRKEGQRERLKAKNEGDDAIDLNKDYFQALWVNGVEPWRRHLPDQGNWEDVYKVAKEYILKYLSASSINTFVDGFHQDGIPSRQHTNQSPNGERYLGASSTFPASAVLELNRIKKFNGLGYPFNTPIIPQLARV